VISFSQLTPQLAPVNPDFLDYQSRKANGNYHGSTPSGNYLGEIPSPLVKNFGTSEETENSSKGIPTSYDLRTVSGGLYITSVKDQGLEGACWAFATYGAIESYWKKIGLSTYNLSEQNLATCHGFDWLPSEGGNSDLSIAYLSRRSGPISETDNPYTLPSNPTCVTGFTPVAYVAQSRDLPGKGSAGYSATVVKQAILDNGALYVNMYYDDAYISGSNDTYYYNGTAGTNHGVTLVGWNDSKVVTGGSVSPSQPGAWIIKNSWGPSWGESGFFYISYQDTKALNSIAYFPSHIDYNSNSKVYFYDDLGPIGAIGYSDGDDYGLVKYVATANQQILKLGTNVLDANTTLSFDVYDNFNGSTLSGLLGSVSNQVCALPGYYTFDLATAINISSGNDFYIKVRYNSGQNYPVPVEYVYADYASNVTLQTGKCWLSNTGSSSTWSAMGSGTSNEYDLCIKAYATTVATAIPTANFTADQTTVVIGTTVNFTDLSSGIPDSWDWSFEGGTPVSSTSQNPSVTYNTVGTYDVTLTADNTLGPNTLTKPNYITVVSAPITCEFIDNMETDDNIVYYTSDGGYITGINDNNFTEFAEYYDSHLNNNLVGARIGVAHADVLSANARITMKVYAVSAGKPGTVLYSEDFDIGDFTEGDYNDITFATNTTVPDQFFIGYQIYTTTPQDTFAIYQAENRGTTSTVTSTAFVKWNGTWRDIDVLYSGDFNTSFSIYPEICPTAPTANFTANITSGCGSLNVQFTDQSTPNTDSWLWNFGDSQTSTLQNPLHSYSAPGTYTVSLKATNTIGEDTKTVTGYIVIGTTPTAVTVSGGGTQCGGSMTLTATGGTGGTIYWQNTTNNGTSTATASSSQSISTSGTYYYRAYCAPSCWGTQGSATVTINTVPTAVAVTGGVTQCGGTTTLNATGGTGGTIYWQNTTSNGTSTATASNSQLISSSGTYYFRSQSALGCWGTEGSATVAIYDVPEYTISSTPESGVGNLDGTASVDVQYVTDPEIIWSNDQTTDIITGLAAGYYTVTVSNGDGCSVTQTVLVPVEAAPVAIMSANMTAVCDNMEIEFIDLSENFPTEWLWDFGDGNTSTEQNPTHVYALTGFYTVSLRVENAYGPNQQTIIDYIVVGITPSISYEVTSATGAAIADGGIVVTVTGGQEPYYIEWSHDEFETSLTLENLLPGDYTITVIEENWCEASETISVLWYNSIVDANSQFKVYPNPADNFINIELLDKPSDKIEIFNAIGELVYELNPESNSIKVDVSDFSAGIYLLKIEFDGKIEQQKVIIK
jgi:PKD repeat protein/C1A family cysteine protease